MNYPGSFWLFVLALWIASYGASTGQEIIHLKLNPEKLAYAQEVEQEARVKKNPLLMAEAWYLYGKMYVFAGDYRTAQAYFMKALRVHEPRGQTEALSRLYTRLGENEERLGNFSESLRFAKLALAIAQKVHADKAMIRSYGSLGKLYETMWDKQLLTDDEKYHRILDCYQQAEVICYKIKDSMGVAEADMNLGRLLARRKDDRAIPYLKKAVYLFDLKHKEGNKVRALVNLSAAYLGSGQTAQAFQAVSEAGTIYQTKHVDDYGIRVGLEKQYILYYQTAKQWQAAFDHSTKLNSLEKSILWEDNNGAISRLKIEYETEKKEELLKAQKKEAALNRQRLRLQQRSTLIASALLSVALVMSFVLFRLNQKNQRISRRNEALVKEQNHRVKNNLQVISSLLSLQSKQLVDEAAKKAVDESRLRVESMAILHRRLYDGDKLAEVNLNDFIRELVQVVLQSYGYTYVQTDFSIESVSLSADSAVPLGLIINELMTNSCKYAFPDNDDPLLTISCFQKKNKIELRVVDNGPGIKAHQDAFRKGSFGMRLIQSQVEQLYGTYQFESENGTAFTMEFAV